MDPTSKPDSSNAEAITLTHVNHLKRAWEQEHASVLELTEQLKRCRQQLRAAEEQNHDTEDALSLEKIRSEMLSLATRSNCDPSEIITFISNWLPAELRASLACCIKIGDQWVVIESDPSNQRIASSGLLDDVVACCGLKTGGVSGAGIIPDDVLTALGWSSEYESVAITIFTRCVWVIIGVSATEAAQAALGYITLLETATELAMSLLSQQIEHNDMITLRRMQTLSCSMLSAFFQPILLNALQSLYEICRAELDACDVLLRVHETSIAYSVTTNTICTNTESLHVSTLASDGIFSIELLFPSEDASTSLLLSSLIPTVVAPLCNWLTMNRTESYALFAPPPPATMVSMQDDPLQYLMRLFSAQWGALIYTANLSMLIASNGDCAAPRATSHPPPPLSYAVSHLSQQLYGITAVNSVDGEWAELICEVAPHLAEVDKHAVVCVVKEGVLFVGGRFFAPYVTDDITALYEQVRISRDSDNLYDAARLLKEGSERADAILERYSQRCTALEQLFASGGASDHDVLMATQETLSTVWELPSNATCEILVIDLSGTVWKYSFTSLQWTVIETSMLTPHYLKLAHNSLDVYLHLESFEWPSTDALSTSWMLFVSTVVERIISTTLCVSAQKYLNECRIAAEASASSTEMDLYESQELPLYAELGVMYLTDMSLWKRIYSNASIVLPFLRTREDEFKCLYQLTTDVSAGLLYEIQRCVMSAKDKHKVISPSGKSRVSSVLLSDSSTVYHYINDVLASINCSSKRVDKERIVIVNADLDEVSIIALLAVDTTVAISAEGLANYSEILQAALMPLPVNNSYYLARQHIESMQSSASMTTSLTSIAEQLLNTVCCSTVCDTGAVYMNSGGRLTKLRTQGNDLNIFPEEITISHDIYEIEYSDTVKVIVHRRKNTVQIDVLLLHDESLSQLCVLRCFGDQRSTKLVSRCTLLRICEIARSQLQVLCDLKSHYEKDVDDLRMCHSKQTGRVLLHLSSVADEMNTMLSVLQLEGHMNIADEVDGSVAAGLIAEAVRSTATTTIQQYKRLKDEIQERTREISELELSLSAMEQESLHLNTELRIIRDTQQEAAVALSSQCEELWRAATFGAEYPQESALVLLQQITRRVTCFMNITMSAMRELSCSTVQDIAIDYVICAANAYAVEQCNIDECFYFSWADDIASHSLLPAIIHPESNSWALRNLKQIVNDNITYIPVSRGTEVVGVLQSKISDRLIIRSVLELLSMTIAEPLSVEAPVSPPRSHRSQPRSPLKTYRTTRRCIEEQLRDLLVTGEYADACRLLSNLHGVAGAAVLLRDADALDLNLIGKCNYRELDGALSSVDLNVTSLDVIEAFDDAVTVGTSFLLERLYVADDSTYVKYIFPLLYGGNGIDGEEVADQLAAAVGVIIMESARPLSMITKSIVRCVIEALKIHHTHQHQHQAIESTSHIVQQLQLSLKATQQDKDIIAKQLHTMCERWENFSLLLPSIISRNNNTSAFRHEMKRLLGNSVTDIKIINDIAISPTQHVLDVEFSLIPFTEALQICLSTGSVIAPKGFRDSSLHTPHVLYAIGYDAVLAVQCVDMDQYMGHGERDIPSSHSYVELLVSMMKHADSYRLVKEENALIDLSEKCLHCEHAFSSSVLSLLDNKENDMMPTAATIAAILSKCFDVMLVNERVQWYDTASTTWHAVNEVEEATLDISEMKKLLSKGVTMRPKVAYIGIVYDTGVGGWMLHIQLPPLSHPEHERKVSAILSQFHRGLSLHISLLYRALQLKFGSKRHNEASSISAEKLDVTTRVLQELFAPGMKLDAMLKGVENTLLQFPDAEKVVIACRENSSNRILYRSSVAEKGEVTGIAFTRSSSSSTLSSPQTPSAPRRILSRGMSSVEYSEDASGNWGEDGAINSGGKNRVFRFASCDVSGEITLTLTEQLSEADIELLSALCRTIGRRAYELYRGSRSKKSLVEAQRQLQEAKLTIQDRDLQLASIGQRKSELEAETSSLQQQLSILRERLSSESKELTAVTKAKKEVEKQLRRQLEDLRGEFEKKERSMLNSLQGLKTQGGGLSKQLEEALRMNSATAAERDALTEKLNKSEQRKKQLAQELVSRRTEFEAKERDMNNQINKYQMELRELHNTKLILEDRIKALSATADDRLRSANDRVLSMEKELAAAKSSASFLKQQNAASSRALQQTQDELERVKVRTLRQSQSTAI